MTAAAHRLFAVVALAAVAGAIVWGIVIVGSPEARRIEKLDERRIDDLQAIVWELRAQVVDTRRRVVTGPLPATLEDLARAARGQRLAVYDPESGEPYGYRVVDSRHVELCAKFTTARDEDHEVFWNHPAGAHCWVVNVVDPP